MTAQDLKNSILQLAVQGKLVPQDSNDEPASELLKRIRSEKERLVKEGKIKKGKALAPIAEDEIPFDIPENWTWAKLGDICTIVTGKKDANFGAAEGRYCFFTCASTPIRCSSYSFEGESILIAGNGDIGNISYYDGKFEAYQRTYVLQPYLEHSYLIYLLFHIRSNWVKYNTDKMFGTAIPYIRLGNVQNYLVALPPLAEQERIVAKIEELLPLIEKYDKAEKQLSALNAEFPDKLRKSILQQAVMGKLTERDPADEPASELLKRIRAEKEKLIKEGKIKKGKPLPPISEDEIPFEIPDTWEWVRLSEICNISDGTHQTPNYVEHGMPFLSAQNIKPYSFIPEIHRDVSYEDFKEYNKNVSPEKGDILMTRVGAGIGEAAIIDQEFEFSIYVSLTLIKSYCKDFCMEYLLHVLNSPIGRKLAEKKTLGKGASQGNLNLVFIREFVLPIPPLSEQKRIVARVDELLKICDELK